MHEMADFDQERGAGASERRDSQQSETRSRWTRMLPFLVALGRPVELVRFGNCGAWGLKILTCYLDAIISHTVLGWLCGEGFWRGLRRFTTCLFEFTQLMII